MRQLTIVATVFLPLSFVAGFFGQNFAWLVRPIRSPADFTILSAITLIVPTIALLGWLRHAGHLGR